MSNAVIRRCLSGLTGTQTLSSDTELISRYTGRNDTDAFATLFHRYGPIVLAACQRVLGSSPDAEDAFQTVFLTFVRSASSIRVPAALPAWLHRTAIRTALRFKSQRVPTVSLTAGMADPSDPFADVAWRDLRGILDEELDRLSEKYRVPLVLCLLDGCTRDETAERLQCSLNTVKRRLDAGRRLLRERLLRRGVAPLVFVVGIIERTGARASVPPTLTASVLEAAGRFPHYSIGSRIVSGISCRWKMILCAALGTAAIAAVLGIGSPRPQSAPRSNAIDSALVHNAATWTEPEKSDDLANDLPTGAVAQFGNPRHRVPDEIRSADLSPDGQLFAVANEGSLVRVYDVAAWRLVRRFAISPRVSMPNMIVLTFSPDGRYLGFASENQYAYLWDLQSGKQLHRFDRGNTSCRFCSFTSDGLFAIADNSKLSFHDPASGREVRSVPVGKVRHLSRDGKLYIREVGDVGQNPDESTLKQVLGDARTGKDLPALGNSRPWSSSYGYVFDRISFAPDGKSLAYTSTRGKVELWGLDPIKLIATLQADVGGGVVCNVGFTPDGRTLFLCAPSGDIVRWDTTSLKELPRSRVASYLSLYPSSGAYAFPDGKTFLSAYLGGLVKVWDAETGKEKPTADHYGDGITSSLSPDGKLVAVADDSGRIDLRDTTTGAIVRTIHEPGTGAYERGILGGVRTMVFNPTGELFATNELVKKPPRTVHRIRVIRVADGQTVKELDEDFVANRGDPPSLRPIGFSLDGRRLLLDYHVGPKPFVKSWDLASEQVEEKFPAGWYHNSLSPDRKTVATDNMKNFGEVLLYDASSGQIKKRITLETNPKRVAGYPFAWSADGGLLVCGTSDVDVVALETAGGRELRRFHAMPGERQDTTKLGSPGHGIQGEWVGLSPDGKWVATTGYDCVGLWEIATGSLLVTFETGPIAGRPTFMPDNRNLLVFGCGIGRRWNLSATLSSDLKTTPAELWVTLNKTDAEQAIRAANGLMATTKGRDLLREKLPPIKLDATTEQAKKWVADLGHQDFATREGAEKELASQARRWEKILREAARTTDDPEVGKRLTRILSPLESGSRLTKDELRAVRLVRAAEMANTAQTIELLREWSRGANGTILTEDAKSAFYRIDSRTKQKPR